jgi:hypothetical protein
VDVFNHDPCCPFHDEILQEFNDRYPDVDGEFLNIILTRPSRVIENHQAYSVIILIWVGLCCLGIVSLLLLVINPRKHRFLRRLRHYGEPLKVLAEIEHELEAHLVEDDQHYAFTENWFIYSPYRNFQAVQYDDIIWMYKVESLFESKLHIFDRYGRGIHLNKPPEWVTEMLKQDEAPWAEDEHGFDNNLDWYLRRKDFISRVDTIRNQYQSEKPKKRKQPPPAESIIEWD